MKKNGLFKIAKLFCACCLALIVALSCFACANTKSPSGEPPAQTEQPLNPGNTQTPETPNNPDDPNNSEKPDDSDKTPNNPNNPNKPEQPENPDDSDEKPPEPPKWATDYTLPDSTEAYGKLIDIYGGEEKIFTLQSGKIARMPCPKDEVITLNMQYEVGAYTKLILDDSIAEFNEVFAVINPHYKFAINYNPDPADLNKKFSVKMTAAQTPSTNEREVFGYAHISYYANFTELGDFGITIKNEVLTNGSYLATTFKHELMHLLGAGDAYNNPQATRATIMQSYTVGGYHHFSSSDVAFIDALYRNPSLDVTNEQMQEYIDGYEENNTHTRSKLTAAVYNMLAVSLTGEQVMSQAAAIGYEDLTEFNAAVKDGIVRDRAFGSASISFTELKYAEPQSETYFGSIDPTSGTYWHGRQTTLGSSQGIKYTDYGDGILYAAPNGNLYTIMIKTGKFVLAFRLSGSFTDLTNLGLTLWHVSK